MVKNMDQLVYDGWLKIHKRKISGKTYDILVDYNAVAVIIENEFHDILLVKQFRPAILEESIEIPAGIIDNQNEEIIECLLREIEEETQLILKPESLQFILSYKPNVGFSDSILYLYSAVIRKDDFKPRHINDQEVYEAFWMSFEELEKKLQRSEIIDVKTIVAYFCIKNGTLIT